MICDVICDVICGNIILNVLKYHDMLYTACVWLSRVSIVAHMCICKYICVYVSVLCIGVCIYIICMYV